MFGADRSLGQRQGRFWRFNVLSFAKVGAWIFGCLVFAMFASSGDWIAVAGMVGLAVLVAILTFDVRLLAGIWILGIPTLFVFPNNALQAIPLVTTDRLIFVILIGVVFLTGVFDRRQRKALIGIEWAILAFLFLVVCSFLTTVPGKELKVLRADLAMLTQGLIMPMITFFIVRRLSWTEANAVLLSRLLLVAAVFVSLVGAAQLFLGIEFFTPQYFDVQQQGRATATFANPGEYAAALAAMLLIGLTVFVEAQSGPARAIVALALVTVFGGLLLSETRANYLACLISVGAVYVFEPRVRSLLRLGAVVCVIAAIAAVPFLLHTDFWQERLKDSSSIYARLVLYATSVNMMIENPLTGIGFGRYSFIDHRMEYLTGFGPIAAAWGANVGTSHNEFLFMGAHGGVLGLALYLLVLFKAFALSVRLYRNPGASSIQRGTALVAGANLVNYVVVGQFVDIVYFNYFTILTFFLLGLAASFDRDPAKAQAPSGE